MVTVKEKSRVHIHWNVNPYDYSKEMENNILAKASKKFGLHKDKIKVIPNFIMMNEKGETSSISSDIIENIQNPDFQLKLFNDYLEMNNIQNYDFEIIKKIDAEINSKIDYHVYDKFRRYSIKWVKWDNFLSYGEGNFFDFTNLKGLVLLNGEPANQSGKTTFAIDLLHFLLFGKTSKATTQDKIFNKHILEATEVRVEGCITIDGEDYIIKRRLTRPQLTKRTVKSKTLQKVEYYKIVGESLEELEDYIDDLQEENSIKTNKIIKEAIGNESDFDMILCATSSNLDDLIEKKESDRGRLLAKWIGLLPIEQKDVIAREKYNSDIKPYLISSRYNSETLQQEVESYQLNIKATQSSIAKLHAENDMLEKSIDELEKTKVSLIEAKGIIDQSLLQVDITTLNRQMDNILLQGQQKKEELNAINDTLEAIGDVQFSVEDYDALTEKNTNLAIQIHAKRDKYLTLCKTIETLQQSEFCPTCGRKYENVDNSAKIEELEKEILQVTQDGKELTIERNGVIETIEAMKENMNKYNQKSQLSIKKSVVELKIEQLRSEYKDKKAILVEYNKNNEIIDKNNQLDIQIRNLEVSIRNNRNTRETNIREIEGHTANISRYELCIQERSDLIKRIQDETQLNRHWKIYLEMIGKNGISKMVLRKTLPLINAQIARLLNSICDFDVEVCVNEKNDVMFYLIKDGVRSDLTSGSGFERTAASLALRTVLANISTLPKMNCIIFDEILGRVSKENYDNMRTLYEKILENYDYIVQISHLEEIKDWHNTIITVKKDINVSKLAVANAK